MRSSGTVTPRMPSRRARTSAIVSEAERTGTSGVSGGVVPGIGASVTYASVGYVVRRRSVRPPRTITADPHGRRVPAGRGCGLPSAAMPTSPTPPPDVLDVALAAAETVGALCDDLRPRLLDRAGMVGSRAKGDGTPVTDIDLEMDDAIRDRLTGAFPGHDVVSEEGDTTWHGNAWTWVVDPIDGTSNFTAGIPYWSVAIALLHDGLPVYGCVEAPPIDARFEAVRGRGATRTATDPGGRPG